jgi:hypothetical protein
MIFWHLLFKQGDFNFNFFLCNVATWTLIPSRKLQVLVLHVIFLFKLINSCVILQFLNSKYIYSNNQLEEKMGFCNQLL